MIQHDAVAKFFNEVLSIAQKRNWLSGEHFSVDGRTESELRYMGHTLTGNRHGLVVNVGVSCA